jgi:hypothetical protein
MASDNVASYKAEEFCWLPGHSIIRANLHYMNVIQTTQVDWQSEYCAFDFDDM